MDYEELFRSVLNKHGAKCTPARLAILRKLLETDGIADSELADELSREVDRSTVYRTIELFHSMGLIVRVWNGWKSKVELSDKYVKHHHHLTCTNCGLVVRIESEPLEAAIEISMKNKGFSNLTHILEFKGLCVRCASAVQ